MVSTLIDPVVLTYLDSGPSNAAHDTHKRYSHVINRQLFLLPSRPSARPLTRTLLNKSQLELERKQVSTSAISPSSASMMASTSVQDIESHLGPETLNTACYSKIRVKMKIWVKINALVTAYFSYCSGNCSQVSNNFVHAPVKVVCVIKSATKEPARTATVLIQSTLFTAPKLIPESRRHDTYVLYKPILKCVIKTGED